jgi:hypothetical protein
MVWLVLAAGLLTGGRDAGPPAPPSALSFDGGPGEPSAEDKALLRDLELLRNYDLLEIYPLIAPSR